MAFASSYVARGLAPLLARRSLLLRCMCLRRGGGRVRQTPADGSTAATEVICDGNVATVRSNRINWHVMQELVSPPRGRLRPAGGHRGGTRPRRQPRQAQRPPPMTIHCSALEAYHNDKPRHLCRPLNTAPCRGIPRRRPSHMASSLKSSMAQIHHGCLLQRPSASSAVCSACTWCKVSWWWWCRRVGRRAGATLERPSTAASHLLDSAPPRPEAAVLLALAARSPPGP